MESVTKLSLWLSHFESDFNPIEVTTGQMRAPTTLLSSLHSVKKIILVWMVQIRSLKVKLSNFENAELPDIMNSKIIQTKYQNSGPYRSSQKCPESLV